MMITIRPIERSEVDNRISEADYAVISRWWRVRAKEVPPRGILPTLGVIAEHGDAAVPVAAAFAYLDATGSGVAWLGWMITDPDARKGVAGRGLLRALDFLDKECVALGYWLSWATVADAGLIQFLERRGYTPTDRGLCHLFKGLNRGKGC